MGKIMGNIMGVSMADGGSPIFLDGFGENPIEMDDGHGGSPISGHHHI